MARILDFRLRPPARGFLDLHLYAQPGRSRRITERLGLKVPASAATKDMSLLMSEMDAAGVSVGVVAARKSAPHYGNVSTADVVAIVHDHPGRFVALSSVGPDFDDPSIAGQVADAIRRDAVIRGVALDPGFAVQPMFCDDRRLYPVYEACAGAEMPVLLTLSGNVGPTIEYSHPVHLDRVAADFPGLRLVVGHGSWPWVQEVLGVAYRRRNVHILPDLYLVRFPGALDYVRAAEHWMQDQFLFGSSYPFVALEDAVNNMLGFGLPEAVLEKVFWTNAARLLGLR